MSLNILYLSCHSILEADEILLFHELGYDIFSPGAYFDPANGGAGMRPPLPQIKYNPEIIEQYNKIGAAFPGQDGKEHLTKEFVDNFDYVIVMHIPKWIEVNWEAIKHKRVIWRTIGQSVAGVEYQMKPYFKQGLEIIRYSPTEATIPEFAGQSGLIRFYKDPEIFKDWNGKEECIINFTQDMQNRGEACNYSTFEEATKPFPRKLYGPNNNQPGFGMGKVEYPRLLEAMRNNRCYFYTGTHPASYTLNFIEALMTGIPMICIGPEHGNSKHFINHNLYEIPELIENGQNGFISDNIKELQHYIRLLMKDYELAKYISRNGRQTALTHFNKDMIKNAWKNYLEG